MTEAPSAQLSSILMAMRSQEPSYRSGDYLYSGANNESPSTWCVAGSSTGAANAGKSFHQVSHHPQQQQNRVPTNMNETWRRKICEWKYQIVDYYNIDREVVSVSMTYLDRYLALPENHSTDGGTCEQVSTMSMHIDKKQFQLAAMTSLYIAIKLYENTFDAVGDKLVRKSNKLRISTLVELSRGYFERHHFIEMEQVILFRLGWKMHPPTSVQFITYLLDLLPISEADMHVLYELARYLAELAVCVYNLSALHAPSTVAYAAILNAMTALRCTNSPASSCLTTEVYHQFIHNVSHAAQLRMDCHEVRTVREALELLCPQAPRAAQADMDEDRGGSSSANPNNVSADNNMVSDDDNDELMDQNSPVCVSKGPANSSSSSSSNNNVASMATTVSTVSMRSEVSTITEVGSSARDHDAQDCSVDVVSPPKCKRVHQSQSDECPWDTLVPSNTTTTTSSSSQAAVAASSNPNNCRMQTASPADSECSKQTSSSSGTSSRSLNFFCSRRVHPSTVATATTSENNVHGPHEC